jgi:hypothetical protein
MTLRKLAAVVPAIAVLALAAPVASASAQSAPPPGSPGSVIPCYPYPAFCGPSGQPWGYPFFPFPITNPGGPILPPGIGFPGLPIPFTHG